ncbi:MAG: class I SAM-dependent methyltransferase [Dehalococcoidia bacterium]
MVGQEPLKRIQWIYSSRDTRELEERYDLWASEYDKDLQQEFGWIGPQRAADVLARHVGRDAQVLDAGAGTGLVGGCLSQLGYRQLEAIDLSSGMLEEARKKGVYRRLNQMDLTGRLGYADDSFDAVISIGVFTVGHAPPAAFDELIRVTGPGGHIVFSLRPDTYRDSGFAQKQEALVASGEWDLVETTEEFQPLPGGEPEVYHQIWVYQVR